LQTIKTMIVDDEARIRRSIERMVLQCGAQFEIVATCADGREALEYMHSTKGAVDLVISDVKMPEMDGMQFVQEAKKSYSFSPIFISGYDDFEYLRSALREGAVDYILKPIDRMQFRERLLEISQTILQQRRQSFKLNEMEKKAELLQRTKQTQALIEATASSIDLSRLGYWVEAFPSGVYLLLHISLDMLPVKARAYTDKDWKAYTYALENIIGEIVQAASSANWIWRSDGGFWALLYGDKPDEPEAIREQASSIAAAICSEIRRYTPFTVSVALTEPIEDLYLLRNTMQKALSLMNYRLVYGGNRIFCSDRMADSELFESEAEKMETSFLQAVQRLKACLARADLEGALEQLRECFQSIEKSAHPKQVQWLAQYVCLQVHAVWMEISEDSLVTLEQALQALKRSSNLAQMKYEMKTWIGIIAENIRKEKALHNNGPIEQAKAWIAAHLNKELTVKSIADRIHMNPTYFCKYFKIQTGETVLDFITSLRLEQAKVLLENRSNRLQDICDEVGYKDVKYFSKLFKQTVGMTPSQYRDSLP
jgi:two-component system response regulator YesN